MKTKPFNLDLALSGAPVVVEITPTHHEYVKQLTFFECSNDLYELVGIIAGQHIRRWSRNGSPMEHPGWKLLMAVKTEKRWARVIRSKSTGQVWMNAIGLMDRDTACRAPSHECSSDLEVIEPYEYEIEV